MIVSVATVKVSVALALHICYAKYMNKCTFCEVEYEAKRKTSKFCSATCRSRANRGTEIKVEKEKVRVEIKEEEDTDSLVRRPLANHNMAEMTHELCKIHKGAYKWSCGCK